ncbi:MAG: IS200/IS605 family transposase [Candidatus Micrarchaeota archaeon]|nr:IS200/IS605 family transposase [Candidatus Micrarchaeota archaeon]
MSETHVKFISVNHTKGLNQHHVEWCPKYRYNCLGREDIRREMESILKEIAKEKGIIIHSIAVEADHVHLFVSIPFSMSVSKAKQYLKGISSYKIFRLHPNFRLRYPKGHFWSIGTFCRSVSNVTSGAIKNYIENHEHGKLNQTIQQLEHEPEQLSLSGFF